MDKLHNWCILAIMLSLIIKLKMKVESNNCISMGRIQKKT